MKNEFVPYDIALAMKELGFDNPCIAVYYGDFEERNFDEGLALEYRETQYYAQKGWANGVLAPLYQQALNFLYLASDGKINISINGKETNEERDKKFRQAIEDLRNLQNNKP